MSGLPGPKLEESKPHPGTDGQERPAPARPGLGPESTISIPFRVRWFSGPWVSVDRLSIGLFSPPLDAEEHLAGGQDLAADQDEEQRERPVQARPVVGPCPQDEARAVRPLIFEDERPTELPVDSPRRAISPSCLLTRVSATAYH